MKVYRIDGVNFKMTPRNTFNLAHEGKDVSYVEYFKEKYGYAIKMISNPWFELFAKHQSFQP